MLWSMDTLDPAEPPPPILPEDIVLELRTVVLLTGGEDAEQLIHHYEAVIERLKDEQGTQGVWGTLEEG